MVIFIIPPRWNWSFVFVCVGAILTCGYCVRKTSGTNVHWCFAARAFDHRTEALLFRRPYLPLLSSFTLFLGLLMLVTKLTKLRAEDLRALPVSSDKTRRDGHLAAVDSRSASGSVLAEAFSCRSIIPYPIATW